MDAFEFIIALVSIILSCVTLWILMFYFRKDKGHRKPDPNTKYSLNQLSSMAESLQDRIDTLIWRLQQNGLSAVHPYSDLISRQDQSILIMNRSD